MNGKSGTGALLFGTGCAAPTGQSTYRAEHEWDTGYPPAAGLDSDAGAKAAAETARELNAADLDRDADLQSELDDLVGEIVGENKPPADRIRLEGDVPVLPVRPHDFRMVSIRSRPSRPERKQIGDGGADSGRIVHRQAGSIFFLRRRPWHAQFNHRLRRDGMVR